MPNKQNKKEVSEGIIEEIDIGDSGYFRIKWSIPTVEGLSPNLSSEPTLESINLNQFFETEDPVVARTGDDLSIETFEDLSFPIDQEPGAENEKKTERKEKQKALIDSYKKAQKGFTTQAGGGGGKKFGKRKGFGSRTTPLNKKCDLNIQFSDPVINGNQRIGYKVVPDGNGGSTWEAKFSKNFKLESQLNVTSSNAPIDVHVVGAIYQELFDQNGNLTDAHFRAIYPTISGRLNQASPVKFGFRIINSPEQIAEVKKKMNAAVGNPPKKSVKYYYAVLVLAKDNLPNHLFKGNILHEIK